MVDTAAQIWRDYVTDGVPSSGSKKPEKAKIREWGTWLEGAVTAFTSNGGLVYTTRALINADLAHGVNASAWVIGDPVAANNGIYRKIGASGAGSWTRVADLPYSFIACADAGAGTANAIVATSSLPAPASAGAALFLCNVFEANTGAVTLALNGAAAKPLLTNSGTVLSAGYLAVGMRVMFVDDGANWRLLTDVVSGSIVAAAEAAAEAAEASAVAAAAALASVTPVAVPDDISSMAGLLAMPSINVLGYPDSPGASNDWIRTATIPASGIYQTDADGQKWVPNPFTIRAEHFGAWREGQDISAALQAAVNYAMARGAASSILMPPGVYYLGADVTASTGGASRAFVLAGQGYMATQLILDGGASVGGLHFEQAALNGTTISGHFRDFALIYDGQGTSGNPALRWKRPEGGISHGRGFIAENVRIAGRAIATDYPGAGIDCSGVHHALIKNYQYSGPWGPGVPPSGDRSNSSIIYASEYGINMDGTYQGQILDSQIWATRYGILNRSSSLLGGEGLHIHNTNIVEVRRGLWWERAEPEPSLWISKTHVNYRDAGLYIDGCRLGWIDECLLYNQDAAENTPSAPIDVYLRNVLEMDLRDNKHHFAGDPRRIAYQVDASGTYESRIKIIRPQIGRFSTFTNLAFVGVGSDVTITDPDIEAATLSGPMLAGGGAEGAAVRIDYSRKPVTKLALITTNQSIANGLTSAAIAWNSEVQDDLGLWSAGQPTRITIPPGIGQRQIKLTANAVFATNNIGSRDMVLRKNGAAVYFGFRVQVKAAAAGEDALNGESGWVSCASGDYFEVFVGQTSGGALDLNATAGTWLMVETR